MESRDHEHSTSGLHGGQPQGLARAAVAREPLPSRGQIEALTDATALQEIGDRVTWAKTKIEADLEFGPGDDEWARRATFALTAHRICLGLIEKRIRYLTRGGKIPIVGPGAKDERKAAKHAAHAERLKRETEIKVVRAEQQRLQKLGEMVQFARKQSWLAAFHAAAAQQLDNATLSRISNAAHAALEEALRLAAGTDQPTEGEGSPEAPNPTSQQQRSEQPSSQDSDQ